MSGRITQAPFRYLQTTLKPPLVKSLLAIGIILLLVPGLRSQSSVLNSFLGHEDNAKLLIIHADDLGCAHSVNAASIEAIESGPVNSASAMVPCPWFGEIAAYAVEHPGLDLGLHLTLTSEWKHYKWGPVAPVTEVPSLVDEFGFFYPTCEELLDNASPEEVETELRAQIEMAFAMNVYPTHFDSHMGCLLYSPELLKIYLSLGREYGIPVRLTRRMMSMLHGQLPDNAANNDFLINRTYGATPEDFKNGMAAFYTDILRSLEPGVTEIVIHLAYDDAEMQAVTIDHPDWGSTWRQADFDFFTSDACRRILEEEKILLVTWRDIGGMMYR